MPVALLQKACLQQSKGLGSTFTGEAFKTQRLSWLALGSPATEGGLGAESDWTSLRWEGEREKQLGLGVFHHTASALRVPAAPAGREGHVAS